MTEDRLSELLNQAVPPVGPALDGEALVSRARRRHLRRRRAVVLVSAVAAVGASVGIASAVRDHGTQDLASGASCSSSPYAGTDHEQAVTYPTRGRTVRVTVTVNDHFTARWSFCNEHGTTTSSGDTEALSASDVAVYSSPRPVPSGQHGFGRPPEDGVYDVRYLAQRPGTVTLHGKGNLGSDGYLEVTVTPLAEAESRAVSGSVDASGLVGHPRPSTLQFDPSDPADGVGFADVASDGTFSLRLRPGTYTVNGLNEAYGDGKAQCTGTLQVGAQDVSGYVLSCVEESSTLVPVDPGGPAAAACLTDPAAVAIVRLNPDTPQPRCLTVRRGQRVRILNSTNSFGSRGEVMTIVLRGFPPQTLQPGDGYTYPRALSDVLAPGYHRTTGGLHGDAQLVVVDR